MFVFFSIVSEFEKVSLKISVRLLYQSSRVFEKLLLKAFGKCVGVKSIFDLFCFELEQVSTSRLPSLSEMPGELARLAEISKTWNIFH